MTRKRTSRKPAADAGPKLSKQCMFRATPEEWEAQVAAAEIEGRTWANAARRVMSEWARKVLAEAAANKPT